MSAAKLKLAGDILSFCQSEWWANVLKPFIEGERQVQIEIMASQTDAMQLMRCAGAAQALGGLLRMEEQAKALVQQEMKKKVDNFDNLT